MPDDIRCRTVAHLDLEDDDFIRVMHVFARLGECAHDGCHEPATDPGVVGLVVSTSDGRAEVVLHAATALVLANRLTVAANAVLESQEEVPDIDREIARYARPRKP